MKLCIQERIFTWGDKFDVTDENGQTLFYVEGEVFSWGKKLHVYDTRGLEVAFIQQRLMTFLPRYSVFEGDIEVAEIVKELSFLSPRYRVDGPGWNIDGEIFAHSYIIYEGNRTVAAIEKEWFTWGDCYTIDVENPTEAVMALCVVVTIDCIDEQRSN